MDNVDKQTRSRFMSAVKSRGNLTTEMQMLIVLREARLCGWRRHRKIAGTPDFCWPKGKVALFVDGCFWHGCPKCYEPPKSNVLYWTKKIFVNRKRDRKVVAVLKSKGWKGLFACGSAAFEPSKQLHAFQVRCNLKDDQLSSVH